jgi:hypothetical protein
VLFTQKGVPPLHTRLHAPQLAASFVRSCSQPLLSASPSQLPHPAAQVGEHPPDTHDTAVVWLVLQTAPQAPQLLVLVEVLVSHPSAVPPEQLPQPGSHVPMPQASGLPVQVDAAWANMPVQSVVHDPQLVTVLMAVSQPLFAFPSQLA